MKNNTLLLCKALFINQLKFNALKSKGYSRNKGRFYLMLVVIVILSASLMGYAYMIGDSFSVMGLSEVLPAYGLVVSSFLLLFFTVLKSNGTLFALKDYEMVMSLPVKTRTIIASRFLVMYALNVGVVLLVMLPMGIAYVQHNTVSALFYPIWLVGMLIAPLFPTTIAAIIGALIVWVASKFRHTNALVTIFSLLFLMAFLSLSFFVGKVDQSSFTTEDMTNMGGMIGDMINDLYPLASLFTEAVIENNIISLGIFVGLSMAWYLLFLALLSKKYKAINTALFTHSTRSNYQLDVLEEGTPMKALYKKELKRFFSSSVYVLNVGMGLLMAWVLSIAALFLPTEMIMEMIPMEGAEHLIERMLPFIICALLGMSCTACVSLSLEGKNIWILQSLPISPKTIFHSKMLVNLTLLIPTALICSILLSIRFASSFSSALIIIGLPLMYCLFIPVWGMFIDIKLGYYDWVSETAIIKQSANALAGLIGSGLLGLLPIVLILFVDGLSLLVIAVVASLVILSASGFLYKVVANASL
jgi:ABC-2 type transport system permease protein